MTGLAPFAQPAIWAFLLAGLAMTVQAASLGIGLSLVIGTLTAAARAVGPPAVGVGVILLAQVLRSLPSYLILLTLFFGINGLGLRLSPLVAITIALGLYHGAKVSEVIRGAVQSVDRRQVAGARALGLSRVQAYWHVVLPQAVRRMQPPLVGELVLCIKNTSLGALVGLDEVLRRGEIVYQKYVNPIETLTIVGLIYWVLCFSLTRLSRRLEHDAMDRTPRARPSGPPSHRSQTGHRQLRCPAARPLQCLEVWEDLRATRQGVGRATVFRTLELLADLGLVDRRIRRRARRGSAPV